ncbi:MAG TPA: sulfatase-like hydrolase/transferase [Chloroflexota bacterium]|nr:sulfatase-like hydrolase/transferase [Chloroflexota bacterium]
MARPNVLVIMSDQFRWDCLGVAGNPDVRTPTLDRLARDGVWFPTTFCPLPVCTPARYSLLSGLYVHQHGGWTNHCTLAPELDTFPRAMRRAGYATRGIGKMHFTPTYLDVGFDALELAEQNGPGRYDDDYHRELMAAGLVPSTDLYDQEREWRGGAPASYWETFGAERSNLPEEWHSTTWIGDRTVRAIERWEEAPERPQLLMASFVKPHHPFDPPSPWDELYDPSGLTILPGWTDAPPAHDAAYGAGYFPHEKLTGAALRRVMAYYYATITQIDHHVGRMIAALERQGLYEQTTIVFTADHGEYLGFHHLLLKGRPMYEPLSRVPLIIKLPRGGRAGEASETLASTVDVAPTILRACGLEPGGDMVGLDLTDPAAQRDCAFAEIRRGAAYMARTRTHKLLLGRNEAQTQLLDLEGDPYELRNVKDEQPEVRAELEGRLGRWLLFESPTPVRLDEGAPQIAGENVPPGREHREALREFFQREMARVGGGA